MFFWKEAAKELRSQTACCNPCLYVLLRQVLQTKRDHVSKEYNEFKADYGRYMATQSKRVTEGKAEHSRLTEKVSANKFSF